ncbi:GDCCVxC domain-containing (seleno)protein [Mariprofundus micogutta]|uniref:GDCCVxC domain-containing (seleno)protein n=1 Tax=Mariprofundus micogutta TaxID=1921010 RepID=UPI00093365E3|nr:GDCCVxC domain-containing (seleno)protein [Mariprofundus micogutta]
MNSHPVLISTLTCPHCHAQSKEQVPSDACQWFYECRHCHVLLRPKPGDCCVFCSYGDVPCPPIQSGEACCKSS